MTAGLFLQLAYGYSITRDGDDPLVLVVNKFMDHMSAAIIPGNFIVDTIPACTSLSICNLLTSLINSAHAIFLIISS